MSKAVKPHCSSCPAAAAAAAAAEKATTPKGNKIKFVLEDTLPTGSDSLIKVKNFKKFLDYDLKTLNITGELQTYTHRNGFTHTKMIVTYQDKKTNKVNYLELDFLSNTNKEVNKNTVGVDGRQGSNCGGTCEICPDKCCNACDNWGGVLTTTTEAMSLGLKSSKGFVVAQGAPFVWFMDPDDTTNVTVVLTSQL